MARELAPVLLVSPWFLASIGGVSKFTVRLYEQLVRVGVDAHVWVCGEDSPNDEPCSDPRISHVQIPGYVFLGSSLRAVLGQVYRSPMVLWRVAQFIRRRHVKAVILIHPTESIWPFVFFHRMFIFRGILYCHGSEVGRL
jgi:hypothetical protein